MNRRIGMVAAIVLLVLVGVISFRLGRGDQTAAPASAPGTSAAQSSSPAASSSAAAPSQQSPGTGSSPTAATQPSASAPASSTEPSVAPSSTASVTPTKQAPASQPGEAPASTFTGCPAVTKAVQREQLDQAWLCGWLNRPNPNDTGWQQTIAPITDPELVEVLGRNGNKALGIDGLTSWKVVAMEARPSKGIDTPTRHMGTWLVTVSDGTNQVQRTIDLISYTDGKSWSVNQATVGYTSNG